jgi:DNA polymerase III subunit epsilon
MVTAMQRSFDELGTPLIDVTFCVVDLETTGGSAEHCAITEIGAVKLRGGQTLGTFHTLVNPGQVIPPEIVVLTGITQSMVVPAPRIEQVLPSFVEFASGCVIVGHNVRFDLSFLNAAMARHGWPRLAHPVVDTCSLARRLVRDEVANCKLSTLAERFRVTTRPTHRALDDALATGEVLHHLIERASSWGVMGLDDLIALPKLSAHPQASKLNLTDRLPRSPGVYLFKNRQGRVLYVGKATNLRSRVRSYFSGDDRRKVGPLLRDTASIDHIACGSTLEAAVIETRLIHQHVPHYNKEHTTWPKYRYVKLSLNERFARLSVVKLPVDDGALYIGPVSSMTNAKRVIDALHTVTQLRRCSTVPGRRGASGAMCSAGQLGVAKCPCSGELDEVVYRRIVSDVVRALRDHPATLLDALGERMQTLAMAERFEEAADVRDRAAALSRALSRQRQWDALRRTGRLVIEVGPQQWAELRNGQLAECWGGALDRTASLFSEPTPDEHTVPPDNQLVQPPVLPHDADELQVIASWLNSEAAKVRIIESDGDLSLPAPALATFAIAQH